MPEYTFRPAVRQPIPLLVGIAGGTGSGKTMSALLIAKGLAGGKRFAFIDTEAGRGLHYADQFDFDYLDVRPPFRPDTYIAAIEAAEKAGYPVVVVDSMSHEWAGDGGVLDWQEDEYQRLGGREASKLLSWSAPKQSHKQFVSRLLQLRCHLILCFRAEPKVDMVKNPETNRMEIVAKAGAGGYKGWLPVTDKNFPYELTVSLLLMGERPGKPQPMKVPATLLQVFPEDRLISEATGRKLGEWAATGKVSGAKAEPAPTVAWNPAELDRALADAALSFGDLSPTLGEGTTDANVAERIDAWLAAHPGANLGDLIGAAIEHHTGQPTLV